MSTAEIATIPTAWLEACLEAIEREEGLAAPCAWDLWPCHACGEAGVRNLGAFGYCATHLAALYATFDPAVFDAAGVGLPAGRQHPEFGPGVEDLRCGRCDATWCGVAGDPCGWCQDALARQQGYQIDLLLEPPGVDKDDAHYAARMGAWAERLVVGEAAGLITQAQSDTAWKRAT